MILNIVIANMKFWGLLLAASALAQDDYDTLAADDTVALDDYDSLGNKVDKGPRWCGGKMNQVKDMGNLEFICRSRNGKSKHPHLTKRCKVQCNGLERVGPKKFFCDETVGWIKRKDPNSAIDTTQIKCK